MYIEALSTPAFRLQTPDPLTAVVAEIYQRMNTGIDMKDCRSRATAQAKVAETKAANQNLKVRPLFDSCS